VTLNVSNIGPMDPNVYLTQAFDPADSRGSGTSRPAPAGIAEVRQNQVVVTIASGPTAWWGKATLTVSNAHGAATSTPITITPQLELRRLRAQSFAATAGRVARGVGPVIAPRSRQSPG
jgi:hypothetical protein